MDQPARISPRQVKPRDYFPSGEYRPIAQLSLEPEDIIARHGIQLTDAFDDDGLGTLRFAALELPGGHYVWLGRHDDAPYEGCHLYADWEADPVVVQQAMLDAFGLPYSALLWQLVIDLDFAARSLGQGIGAEVVQRSEFDRSGARGLFVLQDEQTVTLINAGNSDWSVTIEEDSRQFVTTSFGNVPDHVVRALAQLDHSLGFRLRFGTDEIHRRVSAEQAKMWPRWLEWRIANNRPGAAPGQFR
jgi:hypothetical protein